jgi:hypothetical protein
MDDGLIETVEEADRIIDRIIQRLEAALQIVDREQANHTPHDDESSRRAFEEHLAQAEKLYTRLMTKIPKMSADHRAEGMSLRTEIAKLRAALAADGWKGASAIPKTAALKSVTTGI